MQVKSVAAGAAGGKQEVAESRVREVQPATGATVDEIRQRAYELHLERGSVHGWDQDDWFEAERELQEKYQHSQIA
jgi:Protein of unknown function (DUF2934)